jgi:His-Xaa-Ser system protein HxsD
MEASTDYTPSATPDGCYAVRLDLTVFRESAVKKAAYNFSGRCAVTLHRDADTLVATLRPTQLASDAADLAGEFCNEVLDQELRASVAEETRGIRDLLIAQAFSPVSIFHPELEIESEGGSPNGASGD